MARLARRDQPPGGGYSRAGGALTLEVTHAIEPLASEWDALADRVQKPPFLRPGWIAAWWRAFGKGTLEIFTLRQEGRLVGLLPLCKCRGALLSPTNWHTPAFGILAEPKASLEFAHQILLSRGGARRVSLAFVDPSTDDLGAWRAAAEAQGLRVLTRTQARLASVEIGGEWDVYENGLSRNVRSDLRRCLRRLREAGAVSFETLDGRDGLEPLLAEGFSIESSGWKAVHKTAITDRPETERFYREVGEWAAQKGSLRLTFLRLDGRALAFEFGIEEGGVHYALKAGFNPTYHAFSPGKLLQHQLLAEAFSRGLARQELGGVESYKLIWANASRDLERFEAFARSPAGLVDWTAFKYGRPLARRALSTVRRKRMSALGAH